jgi:hypothetical protein
MAELFTPSLSQLSRLTKEEYQIFLDITMGQIQAIDSANDIPSPDSPPEEIAQWIIEQRAQMERNLEPIVSALLLGRTSISGYERNFTSETVNFALMALLLAVGGINGLRRKASPRSFILQTRDTIRRSIDAIRGSADIMAGGRETLGRIKAGIRRRSQVIRESYERNRHLDLIVSRSHNEGKRFLTSPHPCPDCPRYERKEWTPLAEIVPIATACVCKGNCKCRIVTRYNPQLAIQQLMGGSLTNQVERAKTFQDKTYQDYLSRHGWS